MTVWRALRLLGFGRAAVELVAVDGQGAMRADALASALAAGAGEAIVVAQAGNVDTGAIDPLTDIVSAAREHDAWVHIDGAFGLWAAASPALSHLVAGAGDADSWATDGHKWLNVPYDCGVVAVRDRAAHPGGDGDDRLLPRALRRRGPLRTPTGSRRPRGEAAGSRSTRRSGRWVGTEWRSWWTGAARWRVGSLRPSARADGIEVLNDVVLNQVLLGFGDADDGRGDRARAGGRHVLGRRAPAGTTSRRCASPCRTGRRPRPTSTAPPKRSSRAPSALTVRVRYALGQHRDHGLVDAGAV